MMCGSSQSKLPMRLEKGDHHMSATDQAGLGAEGGDVLATLGDGRVIASDSEAGRASIEFTCSPAMCHSGGVAQGGFVTGWIDAAMAHACIARYTTDYWIATLEVKVTFFRPATPGVVVAEGWIELPPGATAPPKRSGTWSATYLPEQRLWQDPCNEKRYTNYLGYVDFADSRVVDQSALQAIEGVAGKYEAAGKRIKLRHLSHDCHQLLTKAGHLIVDSDDDPDYEIATDYSIRTGILAGGH